jgi:hypothetical protein
MMNDPVPFLANVIAIAHADGKLSPGELAQLESMRSEIGFKRGDITKATKLVEQSGYVLSPVGSFADQVKNLECILRVAHAGSEPGEAESALIRSFCQKAGIYPDQLAKIVSHVLTSLSQAGRPCPSCEFLATSDAQYCPKCGTALTVTQVAVQLEFAIPSSGIAIEFAESTAASFRKALEIAKAADDYQSCRKMKKTWHLAIFNSGAINDALPLAESLSGIRNRKVFRNGAEVSWDELFGFAWCAASRAIAYRPIEYCFGKDENRINPWGCKQAQLDWGEWSDWFSYGRWEDRGTTNPSFVWRFDKDRIRHELATRLFQFRFCPHLDTRLTEAVIRLLPEQVSPGQDENWRYNRIFEEVPGAIKVVELEGSGDFAYPNEYWADGVRPVGHRVLAEILTQAFKELGVNHTSAAALLK